MGTNLWVFFLLVFGVVILPGLDMAYVLASSLTGGRRSGLFAVGGIMSGAVCHVTAGTLGIGLLLSVVPTAFNLMLLAGALYIAWIGLSLLRSPVGVADPAGTGGRSPWLTFRQGALTNLLNPKAYVFMLAVFPQFLRPGGPPLWMQALPLGVIIGVTQAGVYGSLALAAGSARAWLAGRPAAGVWISRCVGAVLILAAAWTGWVGWRGV